MLLRLSDLPSALGLVDAQLTLNHMTIKQNQLENILRGTTDPCYWVCNRSKGRIRSVKMKSVVCRSGCGLDAVWMQSGCGQDAVWMRSGCGLDAVWMQSGCGLDVVWMRSVLMQSGCGV